MNKKKILKQLFEEIRPGNWFIKAKWKNVDLDSFDTPDELLEWNNGTWISGAWYNNDWKNGTWLNGKWFAGHWYNGTWKNGHWFSGFWDDGIWEDGVWENGKWSNGIWKGGTWVKGFIQNPQTRHYVNSKVSPNECKWSLSYGQA